MTQTFIQIYSISFVFMRRTERTSSIKYILPSFQPFFSKCMSFSYFKSTYFRHEFSFMKIFSNVKTAYILIVTLTKTINSVWFLFRLSEQSASHNSENRKTRVLIMGLHDDAFWAIDTLSPRCLLVGLKSRVAFSDWAESCAYDNLASIDLSNRLIV